MVAGEALADDDVAWSDLFPLFDVPPEAVPPLRAELRAQVDEVSGLLPA